VQMSWSTLSRLVLWRDCLTQIRKGLLVGAGPGQYPFKVFNEVLVDPHNMFLRYGVEFGGFSMILIFIILIYPFLVFIKKINLCKDRTLKQVIIFAPPLIGTLIHSQIDSTITSRTSGPIIWLIWAIFVKKLLEVNNNDKPVSLNK
jgi:O-antigen ligase